MNYTTAWTMLQALDGDTRSEVLNLADDMNLDLLGADMARFTDEEDET